MKRHLTPLEVTRVVTLLKEGHTQRYVAERLEVRQSVVWRLWRQYQITGNVTRRHGQRRHRAITALDDRFLRLQALRKRTNTARALQNELLRARGRQISDQTRMLFLEVWRQIPQENIRRVIRSMPRSCEALTEARGGPTRY
ncbi:hypothetical protein ILUMI_09282 [Ignelater luminosus]|uniref:Uncharacterized protein n=1 Tax=Ignelater luminosus TaxID=2038154 RepID=A0A8K0G9T9_IGNLU|nr:hypothetical protein ILUMI_09282 [Ignelater luminosus]